MKRCKAQRSIVKQ